MPHLPAELLVHIVGFLREDAEYHKTLSSLCKASRYFLQCFQQLLYDAPESHWLTHRDLWYFIDRILCTVHENEDLAAMVRHLDLHILSSCQAPRPHNLIMRYCAPSSRYSPEEMARFLSYFNLKQYVGMLLRRLPNLETLEISSDVSGAYPSPAQDILFRILGPYDVDQLWPDAFGQLRSLSLCEVPALGSFITVPSLQTLELDAKHSLPDLTNFPDLNVTSLTVFFAIDFFLNPAIFPSQLLQHFMQLIAICTKIKHLRLFSHENSWTTFALTAGHTDWGWHNLCHMIAAAARTLETLDLTNSPRATPISRGWMSTLHPVDGLAHFTKLKSLTIFDKALYIPCTEEDPSFVTALPKGLEHLHVQWTHPAGADNDFFGIVRFDREMQSREHLSPNLDRFMLHDGPTDEVWGQFKLRNVWVDSDDEDELDEG